jgi:hypothetical protein
MSPTITVLIAHTLSNLDRGDSKDVEETQNQAMIILVRGLARGATLVAALVMLASPAEARSGRHRAPRAAEARVAAGLRVSVQPINGELGPALRGEIARLLRGRGCRVVTSLPRVEGTGQYLSMAKDHRLAAFVSADLEERGRWDSVTFLVWDGASGNVLGRWSASAAPKNLARAVAKGFWKALGAHVGGAQAPPSDELPPAEPLYVNAGEPLP